MTIVPWAVVSSDVLEKIVGVLLCRAHPNAVRLRPAQGDGGIDVMVPVGNDGRVADVYQVKMFPTALDKSRRQQIMRSLRRVSGNTNVEVRDWYLTLPINPSPPEWEWFTKTVRQEAPFPCHWFGLDQLESLAADHQVVIDYYLRDGRDRLEQSLRLIRDVAGLLKPAGALITPSEAIHPLTALHEALNRDDPHYRYEFEVTAEPPPIETINSRPALVASVSEGFPGVFVTFHVYARYRMACDDAPIPLALQLLPQEMDEGTAESWDRALRYGTAVDLPPAAVAQVDIGLPGGLGGTFDAMHLRLGPARDDDAKPYRIRFVLLDDDDAIVAETVLDMEPVTRGMSKRGIRAHGVEHAGVFNLEILTDLEPDGTVGPVHLSVEMRDVKGLSPGAICDGVRFLGAFGRGTHLHIASEFGPAKGEPIAVPEVDPIIPADIVEFIDNLADLQRLLDGDLRMPDLNEVTRRDLQAVRTAAGLARGETVEARWDEQTISMGHGDRRSITEGSPVQIALVGSYRLEIGDHRLTIEPVTWILLAAELTIVDRAIDGPSEFAFDLLARPALGNRTMLLRPGELPDTPLHVPGVKA